MLAYWRVIVTHGITVECHSSDLEMIEEISSNYNPIETSKSIVWEHDIFPGFKQTLVGWLVDDNYHPVGILWYHTGFKKKHMLILGIWSGEWKGWAERHPYSRELGERWATNWVSQAQPSVHGHQPYRGWFLLLPAIPFSGGMNINFAASSGENHGTNGTIWTRALTRS